MATVIWKSWPAHPTILLVIQGRTLLAAPNLYAWHVNGSLVAGQWPTWYSKAGIYGLIAAGDLNGDDIADVAVGRDHHYLTAYNPTAKHCPVGRLKHT